MISHGVVDATCMPGKYDIATALVAAAKFDGIA